MKETTMNGAECLLRTLLANGVDTCFMNPGTSEMQFVSALDRVPGMRAVLCLFEGVCSGAADGYARMTRQPAATLLHLGPGLANGLANFHNARKARSPVVGVVGQHSTRHLRHDAPLTADIEALARPVSGFVRTVARAAEIGRDASAAVAAACAAPGQVATLIVPADFSWSEAGEPGSVLPRLPASPPQASSVREAAAILKSGEPAGLMLGGGALLASAFEPAAQLAAAAGVRVFGDRYAGRYQSGGGRAAPPRLPYFPEPAEAALAGLKHLILVESEAPVSFFGYPGRRSELAPEDCAIHVLASVREDGAAALRWLARECGVDTAPPPVPRTPKPEWPGSAALTPGTLGRVLAHLLPDDAIVSEESVSSSEPLLRGLAAAAAHDLLPVSGGAIGQGLPVAVGAAVACPGRKVIALEADGSALYTPQSLWTMARERLDVTVVILANRRYRILEIETRRTGAGEIGPRADEMMDLTRPDLDWVKLSEGLGVEAARAATVSEFAELFRASVGRRGPLLIEAALE
jgi:acetolactate synthase-1/2/3 large subunit